VDLAFARGQMALSLAFHIIWAAVGVAMPVLMVLAEAMWRRTGDEDWLRITRAWAKGVAVMFAVGAVSGTVLSFELGLLFPGFMRHAGAIVGMPFSLEGFAFFLEAIFLGIYLYGWERVSPRLHLAAGVGVALSGLASLVFVMLVNAWMNAPTGFRLDEAGRMVDIDPVAGLATPFALASIVHMAIAAYLATAIAAAAIHAGALLRRPGSTFHRKALGLALAVVVPAALAQPLSGHYSGETVATWQPMKLAAMESQFVTERGAPARIGGIPDEDARTVRWAIEIPGGLSFLATGSLDGEVQGLEEFPREDWPSPIVHYAFQVMVAIGGALAALALWVLVAWWRRGRRGLPDGTWLLRAIVLCGPLGFLAIEAGWTVTEVGRQPWVIYGVLRTADAVTPMPGLVVPFTMFTLLYLGLGVATVAVLWRQVRKTI
jgi:cytochrome d ubiquinol oxidase subunit I